MDLVAILRGCSSNIRAERSAAESALTLAQRSPGAAPALLRLAADKEAVAAEPQVAQAAAIALKNLAKSRWVGGSTEAKAAAAAAAAAVTAAAASSSATPSSSSTPADGALPDDDKATLRANLFEALCISSPLVRSQIAEVIKVDAGHDFPLRWPTLTGEITRGLAAATSSKPDQLGAFLSSSGGPAGAADSVLHRFHASLLTLRVLCRLFEFRDRGVDGPLTTLITETFADVLYSAKCFAVLGKITTTKDQGSGAPPSTPIVDANGKSQQLQQQGGGSSSYEGLAPFSGQLGELVKLALKSFWSACYMGLPLAMTTVKSPPVVLSNGQAPYRSSLEPGGSTLLEGWLELIHDLISQKVPLPLLEGSAGFHAPPDPLRDPEAAAEWPWWKAQKWALHVVSRLSSRYGDPKSLAFQHSRAISGSKGTPAASNAVAAVEKEREFAESWAKGHGVGEQFLQAVLEGPLARAGAYFNAEAAAAAAGSSEAQREVLQSNWVSPRALNLALKFVNLAVPLSSPWRALKPHAAALVSAVSLPCAAFDDADEELWDSDPAELVRRSNDVVVELYSPRAAAVNFVVALCRQRGATALAPTMTAIGASLQQLLLLSQQQQQQQQPQGAENSAIRHVERRADGALLLAGSLADTLKKKPAYASQIEPLLSSVVLPLFSSPRGHLRARACWVVGQFADAELLQEEEEEEKKKKTGAGPVFDAMFDAVVASLNDPELPVRIDAAVALRALVEAAAAAVPGADPASNASGRTDARVAAALPDLLRVLLQLMSQVDNEDLVTALEALVERAGPGVAPFAAELTRELVAAFNRMAPAVSPAFVNANAAVNGTALAASSSSADAAPVAAVEIDTTTKDTADDRDDDAAMAAFSVLRALLTIIDAVSAVPGAVQSIEPHLLPLVARLVNGMGDDAPDVFEEGLDLLSFLTYYSPTISADLWRLWPETVQAFHSWAGEAYLENMYTPLSNLIRRDTRGFLAGRNPHQGNRTFVEDLVAISSAALLGDGGPERLSKNSDSDSDDDDDGSADSDEYDLIQDFEEVAPAARLLSIALQACCRLRQEIIAEGSDASAAAAGAGAAAAAAAVAAGAGAAAAAAAAAAVAHSLAPLDASLPAIVNIAVDRLQGLKKRKVDPATGQVTERRGPQPPKRLREVLLRVVADALSYDAAATLNAIGLSTGAGAEGVAKFFEIWIMLATAKGGGKKKKKKNDQGVALENFKRAADKKSAVLGFAATLSAPPGSLPPAVEAGAGHVLSAALGLLSAWREQRARSEREEDELRGGGGGGGGGRKMAGWGVGSSDDDDDDDEGAEDEEEGEDGDADVYVRRLAAAAAKRAAKVAAGGEDSDDDDDDSDDSDDDDGWGSDSDDDYEDEADSPLLAVDPRAVLLASVNAARQLGRLAGIEHDAGMRGTLEALAAEVGGGSRPSSAS